MATPTEKTGRPSQRSASSAICANRRLVPQLDDGVGLGFGQLLDGRDQRVGALRADMDDALALEAFHGDDLATLLGEIAAPHSWSITG